MLSASLNKIFPFFCFENKVLSMFMSRENFEFITVQNDDFVDKAGFRNLVTLRDYHDNHKN